MRMYTPNALQVRDYTEAERRAREAGARELTANVNITARPVFERCGFVATHTQQVARGDVTLANFRMGKVVDTRSRTA